VDSFEPWRGHTSDHFDTGRQQFFNPWKNTDKRFADLLLWWMTSRRRPWPRAIENRPYAPPPLRLDEGACALTSIGHATMLVRLAGLTLLTDPHFSTHAGAFGRLGPRRVREPGLARTRLPAVDVVFVSHSHYDHLDVASLRWLDRHRSPLFVTCLGLKRPLARRGLRRVVELDWWESLAVGETLLTVTPAQHWSNRTMFDLRRSLWGGCYLRHPSGGGVYFAGDTAYAPFFAEIRDRLGAPAVALLPIGAYEPRWFMRDHHMNPDEAVRAHKDLAARTSVGIHHGFFRLTDEAFDDPVSDLVRARADHAVSAEAFRVIDVGESMVVPTRRSMPDLAG
jgi:L-ascorbate metabolism protein UlaG (beta-lactamase superfamily)